MLPTKEEMFARFNEIIMLKQSIFPGYNECNRAEIFRSKKFHRWMMELFRGQQSKGVHVFDSDVSDEWIKSRLGDKVEIVRNY